jgi:hypothetical protein
VLWDATRQAWIADKHAGGGDGKHLACVALHSCSGSGRAAFLRLEVANELPCRSSPKTGGYPWCRESSFAMNVRPAHGIIAWLLVIDEESSTIRQVTARKERKRGGG